MDEFFREKVKSRILRAIERLPESGCWIWMDCLSNARYGNLRFKPSKEILSHRWSYKAFKGDIPDGMHVLHTCDVNECVNPEHLIVGTNYDNIIDSVIKGRRKGVKRNRPSGLKYKPMSDLGKIAHRTYGDDVRNRANELLEQKISYSQISKLLGTSRTWVHRFHKSINA